MLLISHLQPLGFNMSTCILKLFSLFSLQCRSQQIAHHVAQRLIWYAKSRFLQALRKIMEADHHWQKWMQSYL